MIAIQATQYHADGIDITVSIRMLNYNFHVETFFSGFYLYLFIGELEKIKAGETDTAVLNNYDESLELSFLRANDGKMFISLHFTSIFPAGIDRSTENLGSKNQPDPAPASAAFGSNMEVNFMGLQDSLEVIFDKMTDVIYKQVLDTRNPFDVGNAGF